MNCIETNYQLFGPCQLQAALNFVAPGVSNWVGSAATAWTKRFRFDLGLKNIVYARCLMLWIPNANAKGSLISFEDGGVNQTQIGFLDGLGANSPVNTNLDITTALQAEITAGQNGGPYRHWGMQFVGDGGTVSTLYEIRLEIVWQL